MHPVPNFSALRFNADGLIPAIAQQPPEEGGRVLMLAWMNAEALSATLATGRMHYWSRSRGKLWPKGEQSGHTQEVLAWFQDCDGDTLLFHVRQNGGGACHTGFQSCFFQRLNADASPAPVQETPVFDPTKIYGK